MEDNKFLIIFAVVLVGFLGFPIVMQVVKGKPATQGAAVTADAPAPPPKTPPLLNEANLINSEWQVNVENYKVKITLGPGGIAYATHPMAKQVMGMEYLEGRWTINYDKIHVSTSFGGADYSVDLEIMGDKVYFVDPKSKKMDEVQRFR